MNMDSLIVPQGQLSSVVKALERGGAEDIEQAGSWLKAILRLCPPCNRVLAEEAESLLDMTETLMHTITEIENGESDWFHWYQIQEDARFAVAVARGEAGRNVDG